MSSWGIHRATVCYCPDCFCTRRDQAEVSARHSCAVGLPGTLTIQSSWMEEWESVPRRLGKRPGAVVREGMRWRPSCDEYVLDHLDSEAVSWRSIVRSVEVWTLGLMMSRSRIHVSVCWPECLLFASLECQLLDRPPLPMSVVYPHRGFPNRTGSCDSLPDPRVATSAAILPGPSMSGANAPGVQATKRPDTHDMNRSAAGL